MPLNTPDRILKEGRLRIGLRLWRAAVIGIFVIVALALVDPQNDMVQTGGFYGTLLLFMGAIRMLLARGNIVAAGWSMTGLFFTSGTVALFMIGGLFGHTAMIFIIAVMTAAALLGRLAASLTASASALVAAAVAGFQMVGAMPEPITPQVSTVNALISIVAALGLSAYLLHLSLQLQEAALTAAEEERRRREKAQDDLLQAQKLDVVGRLSGGIAHDFNNLLTVILSAADLLRMDAGDEAELLDDVEKAVRRAGLLTNRLLAFARPEVSQPKDVDIAASALDLWPLLQRLVGDETRVIVDASGPVVVYIDPVGFEQILLNLVVNAHEAINGSGTIDLLVERQGDDAALIVQDTGPGVPPELIDEIFQPFFSTKERGTGLGLATVAQLSEASLGRVQVSNVTGGARFEVRWRARDTAGERAPNRADDSGSFGIKPHVLLVEDNESVRRAAAAVMRSRGWKVTEATDGLEALTIFEKARFDIVVTDNAMHGISGREFIERIRGMGSELPAVLASGNPVEGKLPDRVSFLPKPYGEAALVTAILELIDATGGL